jgi:hypothetical protein
VSNIEAFCGERQGEDSVSSYILAYRSRPSAPEGIFYVAVRNDILRRSQADWRIARREVHLDQTLLLEGALSTLL